MRRTSTRTLLCAVVLAASLTAGAASLKVSPASLMVNDVAPGKVYDIYKETGVRLTVFNDDDVERAWVLSTYRPSERGRWETGYGEIPDAEWCWFRDSEITIAPNSVGYGHLFLRIPGEEQYFNQHWVVTLTVEGKSGRPGLGLAVEIRFQIETKNKSGLTGAPYGPLAMEPSAVQFDDVLPGVTRQASVLLYNNDLLEHTYRVGSIFLDKKHQPKTYLQQSYKLIPEHTWLEHAKTVRIKPRATARLDLTLRIPNENPFFGRKWEDCILVKPDDGRAEFVRVQVKTQSRTAEPATEGAQP